MANRHNDGELNEAVEELLQKRLALVGFTSQKQRAFPGRILRLTARSRT